MVVRLVINMIFFLLGFYFSSFLDTYSSFLPLPSVQAAFIITILHNWTKQLYRLRRRKRYFIFRTNDIVLRLIFLLNYVKLGLIYGLIVDALKLGS